ncbi:MAG: hypothetical protein QXI55_07000 [Thermofilum sp.]
MLGSLKGKTVITFEPQGKRWTLLVDVNSETGVPPPGMEVCGAGVPTT